MSGFNFPSLQGHPHLARQLSAHPNLSHSYIISGQPEEEGRKVAQVIAQAMLCAGGGQVPCGACPHCTKIAAQRHPDCITISPLPKKREILAEQIRDVRTQAFVLPNQGERKIFIIDQATQMNEAAQNILLKTLEEGPSYVAFLLLAAHPDLLLPTIRSRCQVLSLTPMTLHPDPSPQSLQLAQLIAQGEELALLEYLLTLEKMDRDVFLVLVDDTITTLISQPVTHRTMKGISLLQTAQTAIHSNVSIGVLCGQLCAALFQPS